MPSVHAGISIHNPNVKSVDMSKFKQINLAEADDKIYESFIKGQQRFLELRYTQAPDTSNNPAYKSYATIEKNGETVAKVDNNGFVETSNALGQKIQSLFANEDSTLKGPALAEDRAAKIAQLLGGTVKKSSTALTQAQFNATPKITTTIDYKAMSHDPAYEQLQKTKQARTLFLAQKMGQEGAPVENVKENVTLQTAKGDVDMDIDDYFSPKSTPVNLDDLSFLIPSSHNIDTLSAHVAAKMKGFLEGQGIPEAPEKITYGNDGQIKLPYDYPYSSEFQQALDDDPAMARELHTIASLTSHNVGMTKAMNSGGNAKTYTEIALNFGGDGALSVTANGAPYKGENEKESNSPFVTQVASNLQNASNIDEMKEESDSIKNFLDYMSMTPEERYYAMFLAEEGLTPEELAALPVDERTKIEEIIQAKIKDKAAQNVKGPSNAQAGGQTNTPLEQYQVPAWIAEYGTELSHVLGTPATETEKQGPRALTSGSKAERAEYSARAREHYETVLKEAGITTLDDHYQQLIQDKSRSEELRQRFEDRIGNDEWLRDR